MLTILVLLVCIKKYFEWTMFCDKCGFSQFPAFVITSEKSFIQDIKSLQKFPKIRYIKVPEIYFYLKVVFFPLKP